MQVLLILIVWKIIGGTQDIWKVFCGTFGIQNIKSIKLQLETKELSILVNINTYDALWSYLNIHFILLYLFQLYSLLQLVSILEQESREGIIIQAPASPNQTSTTPSYGSVLQPSGMEREELRVYHSVLVVVFVIVIFTCFLLLIGMCKVYGVWQYISVT